jgi:lipid II:glycine glycyltransferase (peptidoglycan interpeptide bridge formation enzyme)
MIGQKQQLLLDVPSRDGVMPRDTVRALRVSSEPEDPRWDAFVGAAPGGSHLQSTLWARVKATQGWRAVRVQLERGGAIVAGCQVLVRRIRGIGAIAYVPRGPLAAGGDRGPLEQLLDALPQALARECVTYLKVQPPEGGDGLDRLLRARGYVPSSLEAAPVATVRVDLHRSLEEILAGMRPRTRNHIRASERRGAVVRLASAEDIGAYLELIRLTAARQGFSAYPAVYYRRMWEVFAPEHGRVLLVVHGGRTLAGTLLIAFADTVVNKMAGWSGERTGVHPNELLQWAGIRWARESGHRYYDLEGIKPALARRLLAGESPPEARQGVAHFKLGFGGEVTLFPGAYDLALRPLSGRLIRGLAPGLERWRPLAHRLLGRSG